MQAAVQYQDGLQVRLTGSPGGRDQVISDAHKFTHQYVPGAASVMQLTHLLQFMLCLFEEISDTGDMYRFIYTPKHILIHTFSEIYFEKKYFNFLK